MTFAFNPTTIETHPSADGEAVAVTFQDGDNRVDLMFQRETMAAVFEMIMAEARVQPQQPIVPADVAGFLEVLGLDICRLTDGNIGLRVRVRTDDGMKGIEWVTTPDIARKYAAALIEQAG